MNRVLRSFFHLLYPPLCLHCEGLKSNDQQPFCEECASQLDLSDPSGSCLVCYQPTDCKGVLCVGCKGKSAPIRGFTSAFDYFGPPATLIRELKYQTNYALADSMAAFLAYQFQRTGWPFPELLVPVPCTLMKRIIRGYNQAVLLAEGLGSFLHVPVAEALGRLDSGRSQVGLKHQERISLLKEAFLLKDSERKKIYGRRLLLLDDVVTTGTTLSLCAEVLLDGQPSEIYAMTFCRALAF